MNVSAQTTLPRLQNQQPAWQPQQSHIQGWLESVVPTPHIKRASYPWIL